MPDYRQSTAAEIVGQVSSKATTAVEFTQAALDLARSEGKRLNAFVTLCEEKALKQAEAVDAKVKAGQPLGLLAGVPVAIKDNISYTGYPTTCGSHILENYIPPYDATVVQKLIEADAIIIGKTNMDEFAMGSSTENSYFGNVLNPKADGAVPGGSSGGSAAAVAAGIVPIALGSDTGGSIRQPASFCGICGLKPTYGAVSRYGLVAFGSSLDQIGPFARTVEDAALALQVISGHDPMDATSTINTAQDMTVKFDNSRKLKIGLPREFFSEGLDSEVAARVEQVIDVLKKDGHQFVDISLPETKHSIAIYYIIASAEASSNLARYDGVKFGLRKSGDKELLDMYGDTREAGFGREVKRRIMIGTYVLSAGYYDAYYRKASLVRRKLQSQFEKQFVELDIILTPTTPTAAFKFGEKLTDPLSMYLSDIYTVSANLAGIPGISIPCGKTEDGRPVGVQLLAGEFHEHKLLSAARQIERLLG